MKEAAGRAGGYFTQINPDEEVAWRAFELSSVLNAPRLLNVRVADTDSGPDGKDIGDQLRDGAFLNFTDTIAQGEEICAVIERWTRANDYDRVQKILDEYGQC